MSDLTALNTDRIKAGNMKAFEIAITIFKSMSNKFFSIKEMRNTMWVYSDPAHPKRAMKLSWAVAKDYINVCKRWGMIEVQIKEGKEETYKVRVDPEFRLQYLEGEKMKLLSEISNINITQNIIKAESANNPQMSKKSAKKVVKKAAPKKTSKLKVVKK